MYLIDQDLADAKAWAKKRMSELPYYDGNYQVFSYVAKNIDSRHIVIRSYEPNGAHAKLIWICASLEKRTPIKLLVFL